MNIDSSINELLQIQKPRNSHIRMPSQKKDQKIILILSITKDFKKLVETKINYSNKYCN